MTLIIFNTFYHIILGIYNTFDRTGKGSRRAGDEREREREEKEEGKGKRKGWVRLGKGESFQEE